MNPKRERLLNALTASNLFDVASLATITTAFSESPTTQQLDDAELLLTGEFDALDQATTDNLSHGGLVTLEALVAAIEHTRQARAGAGNEPKPLDVAARRQALARPSLAMLASRSPSPAMSAPGQDVTASVTINQHGSEATPAGLVSALLASIASGRNRSDGSEVVATLHWEYPPERQLTDDPTTTTQALLAALSPGTPESLVAAGGICGPVTVDYSIPSFTTAARPVKAGLPGFQATRGGIRYTPPPAIEDTTGATGIWTNQDDIDASDGTPTKPCLTLVCEPTQEVLVYGVPTCVRLGNFMQRYNTELVASWLDATNAAAARTAEVALLTAMVAASTAVTATGVVGASRELLAIVDQATAAVRYRGRIPRGHTMRVVLQEFVRDMLRADVARSLAHKDAETPTALAVADSVINAWFSVRNISPIWALDQSTDPWPDQAPGALTPWPSTTGVLVFPEGAFVFLDGGTLDVGIVRDSTLNATNEAQIFVEPFEAVAFRGVPGSSLAITATIKPSGMSAGTLDTSA